MIHQASSQSLTFQIVCKGEAKGLKDTLSSLAGANRPDLHLFEMQLLPIQLKPAGLARLTTSCANNPNLIWWCSNNSVHTSQLEAEARSLASQQARGAWIWWLEAGDLLQPNALTQWVEAVNNNPNAQVVAGDGDQLDTQKKVLRRHGAIPPSARLVKLVQEQLYCPGAICIKRRMLRQIPLPITPNLSCSYREAWLVEVLEAHRDKVQSVQECWVQTPSLVDRDVESNCRKRAVELTAYLGERWGKAPAGLIHRYGLQLQLKEAEVPAGSTPFEELTTALEAGRPWIGEDAWARLQLNWGLNSGAAPWQEQLERTLCMSGLEQLWCVELLRNLIHPELGALQLGSPWGPKLRLAERLLSPELWKRYRLLRQDESLIQVLNQPVAGMPLIALLHWQREPELLQRFPLPKSLKTYRSWWAKYASSQLNHVSFNELGEISAEPWKEPLLLPEQRPFGVNLIGHAYEVFGIGEDVRMAALALDNAKVPYCVVNVPANNGADASDRSLEPHVVSTGELGSYRFNLVCLSAPSHGAWIAREGLGQQRGRTTIAAWPWETQTWPSDWHCIIPLANAFWPSSTFTAKALEPFSDPRSRPMRVMPMAVHIEDPEQYRKPERRIATRNHWGLDHQAYLFLFVFDVKSSMERKNPWGAIQAFQKAFPKGNKQNTKLIIKALRPASANQTWERLQQQVAEDARLKVIEDNLSRNELLALIGSCDAFLSLHRSEGFGRGIAEAGILGLEVVTSSWGGNIDFCRGERFHLVPCSPKSIAKGAYANAAGHTWGEPDVSIAAQLLRELKQKNHIPAIQNSALGNLTSEAAGRRYRKELLNQVNTGKI